MEACMSKDFTQAADDVMTGVGLLRKAAPDAMNAFGALSAAATASKAIDTKSKELMALAIGIAVHCDGLSPTTPRWPTNTGQVARK
jgi:alkylhydroperoxidase/carboxymuconolactone decarboxylase family protein YurZ